MWLWLLVAYTWAWEEGGITGMAMLTIFLIFMALVVLVLVVTTIKVCLGLDR